MAARGSCPRPVLDQFLLSLTYSLGTHGPVRVTRPRGCPLTLLEALKATAPWVHLQGHGEVAGLGVPDNARVHGRLEAPAPLQVAHSVLVQVPGEDGGKARPDSSG